MLIGHKRIWDYLTTSAGKNRLAHAYLFTGLDELGKKTLALEFAKWLLCQEKNKKDNEACGQCRNCLDLEKNQHPDVFVLGPAQEEKKGVIKTSQIGLDEIKELQQRLILSAYAAPYKIAIVHDADWLTNEAANAFLKTLEEPSGKSLIFITAPSEKFLLPTIVSRCQLIKFLPVAGQEISKNIKKLVENEADLNKIIKLAVGRPGRALKLAREPEALKNSEINFNDFTKLLKADLNYRFDFAKNLSQNTESAQNALAHWLLWLRGELLRLNGCSGLNADFGIKPEEQKYFSNQRLSGLCSEIQKTKDILNNPSFNSRLALEILMTKL